MELIQQQHDNSCAVACLAMMLGKTYEDVQSRYFSSHDFDKGGVIVNRLLHVLEAEGVIAIEINRWMTTTPGILRVPSLNIEGGYHFVYYQGPGLKILDPNEGRLGRMYYAGGMPYHRVRSQIVSLEHESTREYLNYQIEDFTGYLERYALHRNGSNTNER